MSLFSSILPGKSSTEHNLFTQDSQYIRGSFSPPEASRVFIPKSGFASGAGEDTDSLLTSPAQPKKVMRGKKEAKSQSELTVTAEQHEVEPPRKKAKKSATELATVQAEPSINQQESKRQASKSCSSPLSAKDLSTFAKKKRLREGIEKTAEEQGDGKKKDLDVLKRTIFVGNLPPSTKPKIVKSIFSSCGVIDSVRLRSVPLKLGDKMLPRRAAILSKKISSEMGPAKAYVVFKDEGSVAAALSLNMKKVDEHHIRVDRAKAPRGQAEQEAPSSDYDRSCSVFLGNLPFDITDEEVIRLFNGNGASEEESAVKAVRVVRDPATNIGKGFGYVLFSDKNAAHMALAKDSLALKNRPLRISRVTKRKPQSGAAGNKYIGLTGAEGRLKKKQGKQELAQMPASSWQGLRTKGAGKMIKSGLAQKVEGQRTTDQRDRESSKAGKQRNKGKRPAVAARKARALGVAPVGAKRKK